ncbi:unnamed protein product [Closterium sp. Naga37s-1]|nr:unnamed protein product [Closterium sp. Naga37s-1]
MILPDSYRFDPTAPQSLLVLATVAACLLSSVNHSAAQTEPFLVTKARSARAFAANCTNDSLKANATAAQRAQELLAANATLAAAIAAYSDAVPLVNRLKLVLTGKISAANETAAKIQSLQEITEEQQARLDKIVAESSNETALKQAVSDAKRRVAMAARIIDDQTAAIAGFKFDVYKAARRAADSSLTGADLTDAQDDLETAKAQKADAEALLADMTKQAARAQAFLSKKLKVLEDPASVQKEIAAQQHVIDDAKFELDEAAAPYEDAKAAVIQAQADVSYANASIPAMSANVSNAKILQSKAVSNKNSADSAANLMASRAYNATLAAQQAEAAAKSAGYTWVW